MSEISNHLRQLTALINELSLDDSDVISVSANGVGNPSVLLIPVAFVALWKKWKPDIWSTSYFDRPDVHCSFTRNGFYFSAILSDAEHSAIALAEAEGGK